MNGDDQARHPIDSVLLIDGDNDPHLPAGVAPSERTLVRVFLRPGAKMPRTLEKNLGALPHCATVVSPRGGANAADFVMSLHSGMLHAVLPMSIPFVMVTNDATLQAMAAELQRLGRIATIWTSHPAAKDAAAPRRGRSRGGRAPAPRRGRRTPAASAAAATPAEAVPTGSGASRKAGGKTLPEVAWAYAARLQRIKDVPSRLKTMLNDIKNRAGSQGFPPEEVLEELKLHHGVKVDAAGRVHVTRTSPASPEAASS